MERASWPAWGEIARDPALRAFGAILGLLHALHAAFWLTPVIGAERVLADAANPVCWAAFPGCGAVHGLDPAWVRAGLVGYALAGIGVAWLFARRRPPGARRSGAMLGLGALLAIQWAVVLSDFRFRQNHHLMSGWMTLAFLLLPARRRVLPALLVSFYFWAGTLKFTPDWWTAEALRVDRLWPLTHEMTVWGCGYVIGLELVLVFGLLSRRPAVFWATVAQLAAFHALSWQVVGFYYPILMYGLLAQPVLARLWPEPAPLSGSGRQARTGTRWVVAAAAAFAAFQIAPLLLSPEPALTGRGTALALNMYNARIDCRSELKLRGPAGEERPLPATLPPGVILRMACLPVVHRSIVRNACRALPPELRAWRLEARLEARTRADPRWRTLYDLPDACPGG